MTRKNESDDSRVILVFLDGVGIGEKDCVNNPFFKYGFNTFTNFFGELPSLENCHFEKNNKYLFPTDALLDVEGLPQSGTGQTSIFCGINAPKIINKHFGPYPYSTLVPYIESLNIFKSVNDIGLRPFFVNCYPKIFFDYIKSGKTRLSVTTLSCILSGIKLNKAADLHSGRGIAADITNERWKERLNYKIDIISPEKASKRLLKIASKNHLTVFEYFLTDHLGHHREFENLEKTIRELDLFLSFLIENLDNKNFTLIVCSDHGNFEDLSIKTHTTNPTLTITAGKFAKELRESINSISDIKKGIMRALQNA